MANQREIVFKADDSQYSSVIDRIGTQTSDAFDKAADAIDDVNGRLSDFSESAESELDKVRQSGRDVFNDMLASSEKITGSVKDRLTYLQRELSIQEKLVAEEREKEKISARMERDAKKQQAGDMGAGEDVFKGIDDEYDEKINDIKAKEQLRTLQMRSARTAFDEHRQDTLSEDDEKGKKGRGRASRVAGAATGGFNTAAGAAGFGAILSLSGFIAKAISEGEELSKAKTSFQGLSDRGSAGVGGMYDLKTADALRYSEKVAQTRGSISNIANQSRNQYSFEKAYSLESGEMNNMNSALRMDEKKRSSSDVGLEMLNFFKQSKVFGIDRNDFTRVSELLGVNNELNSEQVEQLEKIDPTKSTMLMRMMGKMGVDSSRISSYTSGINSGITDPKNDFSQAMIYRALKNKNPEMSVFELQERQEQGIYGKGNLSAVMNQFGGSASGEMLMKTVSESFGLKKFQSRNLVEAWEKDNTVFDDDKGIKKARQITQSDVRNRASENTTVLQGLLREFNDTFAGWGEKMLGKLGEYTQAFDSGGFLGLISKMGSDIKDAIASGMKDVYDYVTGKNTVDARAGAQAKKEGIPEKGWFGDTFNDITEEQKKRRQQIWNEQFEKDKKGKQGTSGGGINFPGGKAIRTTDFGEWITGGMFNSDVKYSYKNYDHLRQTAGKSKFVVRGDQDKMQDTFGNMTREEHSKAFNMSPAEISKWDKKDGRSDNIIELSIFKEMLSELRKSNAPKRRDNRVKNGK